MTIENIIKLSLSLIGGFSLVLGQIIKSPFIILSGALAFIGLAIFYFLLNVSNSRFYVIKKCGTYIKIKKKE